MGSTIAWTFNERGVRNVYVADGPAFEPRRLTPYREDDGQELTQLSFTRDGATLVYVRGGDHGSNRQAEAPPNPAGNPVQPKIQIWSVPIAGGAPRLVGDGDEPAAAPDSARVAFVRNKQNLGRTDRRLEAGQQLFYARGTSESPAWSPDGRTLAFVSSRSRSQFHRAVHGRPADPVRRAVDVPRFDAGLVARRTTASRSCASLARAAPRVRRWHGSKRRRGPSRSRTSALPAIYRS